jgi:hypothetical protein
MTAVPPKVTAALYDGHRHGGPVVRDVRKPGTRVTERKRYKKWGFQ